MATKQGATKRVMTPAQCEAQHKNFCIFIVKGAQAQYNFLSQDVSPDLLEELAAVHEKILTQLGAHTNGKA